MLATKQRDSVLSSFLRNALDGQYYWVLVFKLICLFFFLKAWLGTELCFVLFCFVFFFLFFFFFFFFLFIFFLIGILK